MTPWPLDDPVARGVAGAVAGLIAGSFVATLAVRWPAGRSVARGRSRCDGCDRPLRPIELVPLASYLVQRGRCRRCGAAIDARHPAIELAGAIVGAITLGGVAGWDGAAGALFGWTLLALAALDLDAYWLPDRLTLPLLAVGLALGIAGVSPPLADRAIGAAVGYLLFRGIASAYRRTRGRIGLGGGDAKLIAAIGAWAGWRALPAVVLIASVAALAAVALLARRGRTITRTSRVPFGAPLALAAWLVWLAERVA